MTAQTSYSINQGVAYAGGIYDLSKSDLISRAAEGDLDFGIVVTRGTDADSQAIAGGVGTDLLGITVRDVGREGVASGEIMYSDTETAGIMRVGYIWAVCPSGCVPGDAVKYVNATGVLDSGAPALGETSLNGARWQFTAVAGSLGVIRNESLDTTAG